MASRLTDEERKELESFLKEHPLLETEKTLSKANPRISDSDFGYWSDQALAFMVKSLLEGKV